MPTSGSSAPPRRPAPASSATTTAGPRRRRTPAITGATSSSDWPSARATSSPVRALAAGMPAAERAAAAAPGAYWREVLGDALEANDSRWTMDDLLQAVADCDAGLVEVAGWLCDELTMGRIQPVSAWPEHYELVPGVRP